MNYEVLNFNQMLTELAMTRNKTVMYFKPVGVDSEKDVNKINAVWDHYAAIVPPEILHGIKYSLHNVTFFDDYMTAITKCEEWFPFKGEMPDEYYVYVHIIDNEGNCVMENEAILPPEKFDA
jgi:hypothetical protein